MNQSYIDVRAASLAPPKAAPPGGGFGGAGLLLVALLLVAGVAAAVIARRPAVAARLERLPGGAVAVRAARRVNELASRLLGSARRALLRVRRAKA